MNTRKGIIATALAGLLLTGTATARAGGHEGEAFYVDARVVEVEPLTRWVHVTTPREVCWDEDVERTVDRGHGGTSGSTLAGTLIGGAIGNRLGKGHGDRAAATIVGAAIGAAIGRDAAERAGQDRHRVVTRERRCETEQVTHEEERLMGYRVVYRYAGRTFVTRTDDDPGETIRVRVRVAPIQ